VELPAFLCGDGWTRRERAHAYALYLGLPAALQPTVAALLEQPGICVPDVCTMLEHITAMDEAQRAELVRLQTSADADEMSELRAPPWWQVNTRPCAWCRRRWPFELLHGGR
jgi:hypothetical protein